MEARENNTQTGWQLTALSAAVMKPMGKATSWIDVGQILLFVFFLVWEFVGLRHVLDPHTLMWVLVAIYVVILIYRMLRGYIDLLPILMVLPTTVCAIG